MCDYYDCDVLFFVYVFEQVEYFMCGLWVECVGGFVGEEDCWFGCECMGDVYMLFLFVGQLFWICFCFV